MLEGAEEKSNQSQVAWRAIGMKMAGDGSAGHSAVSVGAPFSPLSGFEAGKI